MFVMLQMFWCWWLQERASLGVMWAHRRTTLWLPATNLRLTLCLDPLVALKGPSLDSACALVGDWAPAPPGPLCSHLHLMARLELLTPRPWSRTAGTAEAQRWRVGCRAQVSLKPHVCRILIAQTFCTKIDFFLMFPDAAEKEGVHFSEPQKSDFHISLSRQLSQQSTGDSSQLKCPVYVYNCSLENLKEQLVHPNSSRQPRDVFFRYWGENKQALKYWKTRKVLQLCKKVLYNYCIYLGLLVTLANGPLIIMTLLLPGTQKQSPNTEYGSSNPVLEEVLDEEEPCCN